MEESLRTNSNMKQSTKPWKFTKTWFLSQSHSLLSYLEFLHSQKAWNVFHSSASCSRRCGCHAQLHFLAATGNSQQLGPEHEGTTRAKHGSPTFLIGGAVLLATDLSCWSKKRVMNQTDKERMLSKDPLSMHFKLAFSLIPSFYMSSNGFSTAFNKHTLAILMIPNGTEVSDWICTELGRCREPPNPKYPASRDSVCTYKRGVESSKCLQSLLAFGEQTKVKGEPWDATGS